MDGERNPQTIAREREHWTQQFAKHGITLVKHNGRWTHGTMPVTGGVAYFEAIIMDEPIKDDPIVVNGGRMFKLGWSWPETWLAAGQRVVPNFDRGWDTDDSGFFPLHAYGESLDCLIRLLVAVGDEPFKERYVDINAVAGPVVRFTEAPL
jgi:hypothetical protein